MLITSAIFGTFVALGHDLEPEDCFTVIAILNILQGPLRTLPQIIGLALESAVSAKRVQKFLTSEELQLGYLTQNVPAQPDNPNSIEVENGNFYWLTEEDKNEKARLKKEEEEKKRKAEEKKNKGKKKVNLKKDQLLENDAEAGNLKDSAIVHSNQVQEEQKNEGDQSQKDPYILKNINLKIKKGDFVAILGE